MTSGIDINEQQKAEELAALSAESCRRQNERYKVDFAVKIFARGRSGYTQGRSSDLSVGGLSFYAPVELAIGQEVQVHLSLPYSRMLLGLDAVVRNVNGFRFGVEFTALKETESAEIERIIKILAITA